ncbi:hypothetical protein PMAYCL1PPCAC_03856, partial [Pristionchus mayeri]
RFIYRACSDLIQQISRGKRRRDKNPKVSPAPMPPMDYWRMRVVRFGVDVEDQVKRRRVLRMPWWCSLICYGIVIAAALLLMLSRSIKWHEVPFEARHRHNHHAGDPSNKKGQFYDRATLFQ